MFLSNAFEISTSEMVSNKIEEHTASMSYPTKYKTITGYMGLPTR